MQERGPGPALTAGGREPEAPAQRWRHHRMLAGVAAVTVALDQLTKWWALEALRDGPIDLVWTLRLKLTFNTGSAFSLGAGRGGIIALIAIGVVIAMLWLGRGVSTRTGATAMGLILGGAVGNLADRAFREGSGFLGGAVVDFVDLQWWPVFNVADAAIVVGAILLLLAARHEQPES